MMSSLLITIVTFLLVPLVSFAAEPTGTLELSSISSTKQDGKVARGKEQQQSLDFSGTGRPGQQTAGESRSNCINNNQSLQAVIPTSNSGKTVSTHPNFWVYLPHTAEEVSRIEFVVQNEAREDIWRSLVAPNHEPGYQNFSLPLSEPGLEIGEWYRWYVKVYCQSQVASIQYVQGWVSRIHVSSKLYSNLPRECKRPYMTYANHGIWYDAVDKLLRLYQRNPGDLALEQDWQDLIAAKGVKLPQLPRIKS